jgi:uncharacterized protein (TIGR00106 family)
MLAEFSTYPLGETHHLSKDVALMVEVLRATGLHFELGPLSTAIEGDWDEVMHAIRDCHCKMTEKHDRVITRITIDDRRSGQHHLGEMVEAVKKTLAAHKHDAEIEC